MSKNVTVDIETNGLNAWYGNKITCICAKDSDGNKFSMTLEKHKEEELIHEFLNWMFDKKEYLLITKNGKGFDVPFIITRFVLLKMDGNYDFLLHMNHMDLQLITKKWIGLNDMACLLGVICKSGSGLDAIRYYERADWNELEKYCMQDVVVTYAVYEKLVKLGVINASGK